jgi:hypothetical protein
VKAVAAEVNCGKGIAAFGGIHDHASVAYRVSGPSLKPKKNGPKSGPSIHQPAAAGGSRGARRAICT